LWSVVFGAAVAHELESAYMSAGLQGYLQRGLIYAEAEAVLLCGFIDRGLVSVPNEWYGKWNLRSRIPGDVFGNLFALAHRLAGKWQRWVTPRSGF
jgi:hypothetical protein